MVKNWFSEFRCRCTNMSETKRPNRLSENVTPKRMKIIHDMVLADRKLEVRQIEKAYQIAQWFQFRMVNWASKAISKMGVAFAHN